MFTLTAPWWQFVARAVIVYAFLLVLVRLSGKRTVGQFTPFDLLVVMLLSEAVSNGLSGGDDSVLGGLILATTLVALNTLVALVSSRNRAIARLLDGEPVLIGKDGQLIEGAMKRHRLSHQDVEEALRAADCALSEMRVACLEADGKISVLKNSSEVRGVRGA